MAVFIIRLVIVLVTAELGLGLDQDHKYCSSIGQQCHSTADCCSGSCSMIEGSLHSSCVSEHQIVKRSSGLSNPTSTNSSCKSYGQRCLQRRECCSNTCEGICVHAVKELADYLLLMRSVNPGYCLPNNVFCNINSNCCSWRCLRPQGKLRLTCVPHPEDLPYQD
ncbi:hypothetical protein KQX54_017644 [Cotesia glomerata]|uniref:Uncharacterized protein n=1 Tax=Cotesia glomerata TaxID=32391 RepID=A0AAV7IAY2_COTGL|nr:hypothetical protein KQX54_017644 [Cotesia glomerata]